MEEIIFRGLMFKALEKKWNRYLVVAFISLTFAIGHIIDATHGEIIVLNTLVTVLYFIYLLLRAKNVKAYFRGVVPN